MKLVAFCLFAVCCCLVDSSANRTDSTLTWRKLHEVLRQVNDVKESLQHYEEKLYTPPRNIEDCCCLSALQCFRANLQVHFNVTERKQKKLFKSLKSPITERGLDFCNSGSDNSTCQDCHSHPKESASEFFNRLELLIQKAINKLS